MALEGLGPGVRKKKTKGYYGRVKEIGLYNASWQGKGEYMEFRGEFFDIESLARYFECSRRTIYRLCQKKALPGLKVGRAWRFSKRDIEDWQKKNKI